jgi:uncharacterized protein YecT (DUF1311 family)
MVLRSDQGLKYQKLSAQRVITGRLDVSTAWIAQHDNGGFMRKMMLICFGLVFSTHAFAGTAADDSILSEYALREECSAYSESGMRDCLATKARESQKTLEQAEKQVNIRLSRWDQEAQYIKLAKAKLVASGRAFSKYREEQCAFAASLGGSAIGNALEIRRLACAAELNNRRAKQLCDAVSDLPLK